LPVDWVKAMEGYKESVDLELGDRNGGRIGEIEEKKSKRALMSGKLAHFFFIPLPLLCFQPPLYLSVASLAPCF